MDKISQKNFCLSTYPQKAENTDFAWREGTVS